MHRHVPPRCEEDHCSLGGCLSRTAIRQYGQMNVFTVVTAERKKKKKDGRRQRLTVVFEAVPSNLGSSGELDYAQKRVKILAT